MSSALRDLWPDDIKSDEIVSPEDILQLQLNKLEERTRGLLVGHLVRHAIEDRVVIGFEVEATRTGIRVRLFEVVHRPGLAYPVAITPPDDDLPEFLQDRRYEASAHDMHQAINQAMRKPLESGQWVENEWIASTPDEFSQKVQTVLSGSYVKSTLMSLLSCKSPRSTSDDSEPDGQE